MTGTFTAGAVLTAANLNTAINSLTLNAQSGAGYTLVLTDAGKLVTVSNASAQNLTIPLNSSVAYATGTVIEVLNIGAGTWTLVPTGGVTLTGSTSIPTSARVRLTKTGTDTWYANTLGGGGLTYVGGGTVSAGSAININNCFTSTYDNYRVILQSNVTCTLRWRVGGADNTSALYYDQYMNASNTTLGGGRTTLATSHAVFSGDAVGSLDIYRPAVAVPTYAVLTRSEAGTGITTLQYSYYHSGSTAFDGLSILGTTMTAAVKVYGYSNS